MKNISLICAVLTFWQLSAMDVLCSKYAWPREKPQVAPDPESMFINAQQLKPLLTGELKLIVELGSWLGGSTRFILDSAPNALVIAIDHWQGSLEHQQYPYWAQKLPTLYETFLVNCWDYKHRLIPIKATTVDGLQAIYDAGLYPDLVYVDAGHDYASVMADLEKIYLLFPNTKIVGDDWTFFMLRVAVTEFCHKHGFALSYDQNFWQIQK